MQNEPLQQRIVNEFGWKCNLYISFYIQHVDISDYFKVKFRMLGSAAGSESFISFHRIN